jgi:GH15 family glucan-1,4-alpha-glucosidase
MANGNAGFGSSTAFDGAGHRRYMPIAEHGLIGDLRTAALVATNGTIDWYCCPRFDAPSVFAAILDADRGGAFELAVDMEATTRQFYVPDTNVLITRFFSTDGVAEVQDFMPIVDQVSEADRHRLIRRVSCVRGALPFRATVAPRFGYGAESHTVTLEDSQAMFRAPSLSLRLSATVPFGTDGTDVRAHFKLRQGETAVFALDQLNSGIEPRNCPPEEAEEQFRATVSFWRTWLAGSRYTGRWREMVNRSALLLKLLTYIPTGAIVAAPTTSLPEQIGGERNWDYRYVWVRDAAFCIYALLRLGFVSEAEAFMGFLEQRGRALDPDAFTPLQIMYGIDGRSEIPEYELSHLEGHLGSTPVRVGNAATGQLQLDIYGAIIDSVYLYDKWGEQISSGIWKRVAATVDWLCDHWDQPDHGIWETRGGRRDFVYSRLMCWVALQRAIRMANRRGLPADQTRWRASRDAIYQQIMTRGWSARRGAFVQYLDGEVLDSSVLMMQTTEFISPRDPRWLSTLDALSTDLVSDSLVYRYDPAASPDGLQGSEGTFSICSFLYVDALTRAGRLEEARLAFEKMLTYSNHLGLYAEEIGPTGEQLGNFPQALTHLSLIIAAQHLDQALG